MRTDPPGDEAGHGDRGAAVCSPGFGCDLWAEPRAVDRLHVLSPGADERDHVSAEPCRVRHDDRDDRVRRDRRIDGTTAARQGFEGRVPG